MNRPIETSTGVSLPPEIDVEDLAQLAWSIVRIVHCAPAGDGAGDPAVERLSLRSISKRAGWSLGLVYERNLHPNSRYDKSQLAEMKLRLDPSGRLLAFGLGELKHAP